MCVYKWFKKANQINQSFNKRNRNDKIAWNRKAKKNDSSSTRHRIFSLKKPMKKKHLNKNNNRLFASKVGESGFESAEMNVIHPYWKKVVVLVCVYVIWHLSFSWCVNWII